MSILQALCQPFSCLCAIFGYDTSGLEPVRSSGAFLSSVHPDIKKITNRHVLLLAGLIALVAQVAAFVFFGASSYNEKMNSEFLSLDSTAGVCESVTLSHTQIYYVDKYGAWDQDVSFKSQEALFVVRFSGYRGDDASWASDMDALYSVIYSEMEYLRSISDLPLKISHLMSWRKTIDASLAGSIRLWFNADPTYIFDIPGSQLKAFIGTPGNECQGPDSWSINDGILTLTFNDVWDQTYLDLEQTIADLTTTWTCDNFKLIENGYNVEVM